MGTVNHGWLRNKVFHWINAFWRFPLQRINSSVLWKHACLLAGTSRQQAKNYSEISFISIQAVHHRDAKKVFMTGNWNFYLVQFVDPLCNSFNFNSSLQLQSQFVIGKLRFTYRDANILVYLQNKWSKDLARSRRDVIWITETEMAAVSTDLPVVL